MYMKKTQVAREGGGEAHTRRHVDGGGEEFKINTQHYSQHETSLFTSVCSWAPYSLSWRCEISTL